MKADSLPLTDTHTHACHEWAAGDRASGKSLLSLEQYTHMLRLSHSQSPGNNISQTNTHTHPNLKYNRSSDLRETKLNIYSSSTTPHKSKF